MDPDGGEHAEPDDGGGDLEGQEALAARLLRARGREDLLQRRFSLLRVAAERDEVLGVLDVAALQRRHGALDLDQLGEGRALAVAGLAAPLGGRCAGAFRHAARRVTRTGAAGPTRAACGVPPCRSQGPATSWTRRAGARRGSRLQGWPVRLAPPPELALVRAEADAEAWRVAREIVGLTGGPGRGSSASARRYPPPRRARSAPQGPARASRPAGGARPASIYAARR